MVKLLSVTTTIILEKSKTDVSKLMAPTLTFVAFLNQSTYTIPSVSYFHNQYVALQDPGSFELSILYSQNRPYVAHFLGQPFLTFLDILNANLSEIETLEPHL